jgi:hypothetical protein
MNLYLLTQNKNTGYDTYDSCVVASESEEDAKTIHPNGEINLPNSEREYSSYSWAEPASIEAELIGIASTQITRGVICASFNAG